MLSIRHRISRAAFVIIALTLLVPLNASGQGKARPPGRSATAFKSTTLDILIVTAQLQSALQSQRWGRIFDKIGYRIRIRRADASDRPDITEKTLGSSRIVKVLGVLNKQGNLEFSNGKKFTISDEAKLKEFLDDLKKYGAQGTPDGQPMWGLNLEQFTSVYNSFGQKAPNEIKGIKLRDAIGQLKIPEQFPVRISDAAAASLRSIPESRVVGNTLKGTSKGAALSITLADFGLGFHPNRKPDGNIEIKIEPLTETFKPWPIGWKPRLANTKTAPLLFKLFPVELEEASLTDLAKTITGKTTVPIHFDFNQIEQAKIKLGELTVTIPSRKATLYRAMQTAASRNRLAQKLRIDELGKPFIYVSTGAAMRRATAIQKPGSKPEK